MTSKTIVLKFGGSVLREDGDVDAAVHEIYRFLREGYRVVAVVSAREGATDQLLARARRYGPDPHPEASAALLATGEATSAALLGLALSRSGVASVVFDAARAGLRTEGHRLDAKPVELDEGAFLRAFRQASVVVMPGFVGVDPDGGPSLLGRGGSDFTALFVAWRLGAACRLVKDINGLFERDPNRDGPEPRRFLSITWDDALALKSGMVQAKACEFARDRGLSFEIASPQADRGSLVGRGPTVKNDAEEPGRPLRVLLLGLGTVGMGIYRRLKADPARFRVVGALVRDLSKDRGEELDPSILHADPREALAFPCDLVVETLGGLEPASTLIRAALARGIDVVTANKEVVERHGRELEPLAASNRARFLYSACVGGGVPVLKNVEALKGVRIRSVEGVLNGTTNYILERLAAGAGFEEAVREAQAKGFAEADPTADLDGTDAARKLSILARAAFPAEPENGGVEKTGIDGLGPEDVGNARKTRRFIRLVARAERTPEGIRSTVGPRALPEGHPLAEVPAEENRIVIEREEGPPIVISGKGAGRWPTAESVLGDALEIVRARRRERILSAAAAQAKPEPEPARPEVPLAPEPANWILKIRS
jgi:homoserine dehydrogenase